MGTTVAHSGISLSWPRPIFHKLLNTHKTRNHVDFCNPAVRHDKTLLAYTHERRGS